LKIQIPALSAALKQPDGALAARLSAMAEAPLATPQKTAAATATTTYLQEAPGVSRAAETLAMVTQARTNTEGQGIFSSTPAAPAPEKQPADARSLQTQLKSLFEPGVAETRIEIATREEPANVLILGSTDEDQQGSIALPAATDTPQIKPAQTTVATQPPQENEQPAIDEPSEKQVDVQQTNAQQADSDVVDAKSPDAKQTGAAPAETRSANGRPADAGQTEGPLIKADTNTALADKELLNARSADARSVELKPSDFRPLPQVKVDSASAAAADEPAPAAAERRSEPRMSSLPVPQNNNYPSAAAQLRAIAQSLVREKIENDPGFGNSRRVGDERMQTMLTLKGIAEVITTMPSKAAEFLMSPQLVADIKAKETKPNAAEPALAAGNTGIRPNAGENPEPEAAIARKDAATVHQPAKPGSAAGDALEQERRLAADHPAAEPQSASRAVETGHAVIAKAAGSLDAVPFAFAALQPAKEEFKTEAAEERGRPEDEGDDADEHEREDPEARRERLARKATDDLLRPEPEADAELKITRDSSQADRAYALYQRMAGF
jgi:hypothetical protein